MRHITLPVTLALAAACSPSAADDDSRAEEGTTYRVYFLGGQSNMDGYGFNKDLPDEIAGAVDGVRIFTGEDVEDGTEGGGEGIWAPLSSGFGVSFSTNGKANTLSDRFGPELTFGHAMAKADQAERIAIIKFSRGGTGLIDGVSAYGSWDPDYSAKNKRNLYDQALDAIAAAMKAGDIDGDGKKDRLVPAGVVWMQGEADAFENRKNAATNYERNLSRLMLLIRKAMGDDDLPVVIGRIKDSGNSPETRVMKFSPQVREAQARFTEQDSCAALVTTTDNFEFIDGWHYRSQDYIALGKGFAEAMQQLEQSC